MKSLEILIASKNEKGINPHLLSHMKRAIPYATKSHGTIQKRWPYVSALSRSATFNMDADHKSCGILHYDTLMISSLYHWLGIAHLPVSESHLSCLTALSSEACPKTGFIFIFIFKFEVCDLFVFSIKQCGDEAAINSPRMCLVF